MDGWTNVPLGMHARWVYKYHTGEGDDLRILKGRPEDPWTVRWSTAQDNYEEKLPRELTREQAMAAALALWRMS